MPEKQSTSSPSVNTAKRAQPAGNTNESSSNDQPLRGSAGELLKGCQEDGAHPYLLLAKKLDLETEVEITKRVKDDVVVGLY
ncbi:unnamed protein product [Clonostachys byssicola]|uniref:Uncharacterized protein n=1 Tax=Clonostachys byssicola TaxID=160290 RepID=A0A9N9USV5_9HYPO|nr:unnamed protein product [Clonostachys byssicola]